jgi:glycerate kinase
VSSPHLPASTASVSERQERSAAPAKSRTRDDDDVRVLVCPDMFHGSATATHVSCYLSAGLHSGGFPGQVVCLPVAGGGEGTIDCLAAAGFAIGVATVTGRRGAPVTARFATQAGAAVIEAAQVVGLKVTTATSDNARRATSRGVGELIKHVLGLGYRDLTVGVGGAAFSDGGAGMLQGLGVSLLDRYGDPVTEGPAMLWPWYPNDLGGLDPRLRDARITVATDTTNPPIEPRSATDLFALVKGATTTDATPLPVAIEHPASESAPVSQVGATISPLAATGIGDTLIGLCGATGRCGADVVLDLLRFDEHARSVRLIVTGEGLLDQTSLAGSSPTTIARRSRSWDAPTIAVVGRCSLDKGSWRAAGFAEVYDLTELAGSSEISVHRSAELLIDVGRRIAVCHGPSAAIRKASDFCHR